MTQAMNQTLTNTYWEALEVRITHKYVGTWRHLDEWRSIGSMVELSRYELNAEDDFTEPATTAILVKVEYGKGVTYKQVFQALDSHYSSAGCDHEHDCCGCRSYDCDEWHRLDKQFCIVVVSSSRNF